MKTEKPERKGSGFLYFTRYLKFNRTDQLLDGKVQMILRFPDLNIQA